MIWISAKRIRIQILKARMLSFWEEYKRSKAGLPGLFMISAFVFFAIVGPSIAPYDPREEMLAAPVSPPEWVTLFQGSSHMPLSADLNVVWTAEPSETFSLSLKPDEELMDMLKREYFNVWSLTYSTDSTSKVEYKLTHDFSYSHDPPYSFGYSFRWRVSELNGIGYNLEFTITKNDDETQEYSLWDSNYRSSSPERSTEYLYIFDVPGTPVGFPRYVESGSGRSALYEKRLGFDSGTQFLQELFSEEGDYTLTFYVRLEPSTTTSKFEAQIFDFKFSLLGKVHGLLGTDSRGRDIFSRLLHGTRISLVIGLLVATVSTFIGIIVGTVSGYLGGFTDEISMRLVDLLMCLPLFPLILTVSQMFGRNLLITMSAIVLLSWMPLSRMIRSQILSLRETAFVEAAIVSGSTRFKILTRHILPNVLPLAFSTMILSVPAAILIEASLGFVGLSDLTTTTWGLVINEAIAEGALAKDAWWWIFSPGVAIVLISVGFVLVANAFDKIVNPRLRARK